MKMRRTAHRYHQPVDYQIPLIDHVRTRPNAKELLTSVLQAPGGPQGFYEKMGFTCTGE